MKGYKAYFTNPYQSVQTHIAEDEYGEFFVEINRVKVFIDELETIFIVKGDYTPDQLTNFSFAEQDLTKDKGVSSSFLAPSNTQLRIEMPITVWSKETGEQQQAVLYITMTSDEDGKTTHTYELFDAVSHDIDIDLAIADLAKQLRDFYYLLICGGCNNSMHNPYGGSPYVNMRCFKKNKEAFWALRDSGKAYKHDYWPIMKDGQADFIDITDYCDAFIPKYE